MSKQKLNDIQQKLLSEFQTKVQEFYDNVPEEEKNKWPNGDYYQPLREIEHEYTKKIKDAGENDG